MDNAVKQEAMPYEKEIAIKLYNEIATMGHQEQVRVFGYFRDHLLSNRKEQQECISKSIDEGLRDLELHKIGSNTIASGL